MNVSTGLYPKVIVFGVFDNFHKGHEYFLTHAKNKCDQLIVAVTIPEIVELLKKITPTHSLEERIMNIKKFDSNFIIVPGDSSLGEWKVLKNHKPDIVFLGYDQQGIARELDGLKYNYHYIDAHHPDKYKSSFFRLL